MQKSAFQFWLSVLLMFAFGTIIKAQNLVNHNPKRVDFTVYKTTDGKLTIQSILNNSYSFKQTKEFDKKTHPDDIYWVKIDFSKELETLKTDSLWYLRSRRFSYNTIYFNSQGAIKTKKVGVFENTKKGKSLLFAAGIPFTQESLIEGKYLFLKIKRVTFLEDMAKWRFSYTSNLKNELINDYYRHQDVKLIIPISIFAGICLIMFLFTFMFFLSSKRLEFLFYALYAFFLFLYLAPDVFRLHDLIFGHYGLTSYTFFQETQVFINLFYILFVMYYLNTKERYNNLHKALKAIVILLIVVIILDTILLLSENFIEHIYLLDIERLIMSVFGLAGMVYLLVKAKSKLAYFIVIGSFIYLLGALGFLFLGSRFYMIGGSSIEILIFAAGLTYKMQQEYKERLLFQKEAYINKNKALRAQINPHFIFNSLSSIQNFITSNNKVSALKYLSKFSRLTRNILESSIETNVVLDDEIKMLNDYLELESLRFDNAFSYNISVDENLNTNAIEVPFMILQPFVENAIIHGLLPKKEGEKKLSITFNKKDEFAVCEIDDNGIGRQAAKNRQHIHKVEKKSRGMQVTMQRIKALNKENTENSVLVIDKEDKNNNPLGTKVVVKFPI